MSRSTAAWLISLDDATWPARSLLFDGLHFPLNTKMIYGIRRKESDRERSFDDTAVAFPVERSMATDHARVLFRRRLLLLLTSGRIRFGRLPS